MEVAVMITNGDLELVDDEGCHFVVKLKEQTMKEQVFSFRMDDWCKKQHRSSGLLAKAEEATLTAPEVADAVLKYIQRWVPKQRIAQLAGSSIHFDAMFLRATGPDVAEHGGQLIWKKVVDHLQHRVVDVSSFKEICRRWYPKVYKQYGSQIKPSKHRALDDIKSSIAELKFYRESIFINPETLEDNAEHGAEAKKRKIE
ncbi:hypothetical protein FRC12_003499 [Ceratobasidium sp. 428]|nr:hypothetical protein FRC12_003499 [Ceratobasidium sp. 428]